MRGVVAIFFLIPLAGFLHMQGAYYASAACMVRVIAFHCLMSMIPELGRIYSQDWCHLTYWNKKLGLIFWNATLARPCLLCDACWPLLPAV